MHEHARSTATVLKPYQQLQRAQGNQEEVKSDDPPLKLQEIAVVGCSSTKRMSACAFDLIVNTVELSDQTDLDAARQLVLPIAHTTPERQKRWKGRQRPTVTLNELWEDRPF